MSSRSVRRSVPSASLLEQSLLGAAFLALVAVASWPAVRASTETFGWLPFWLLALPLSAWVCLRIVHWRYDAVQTSDVSASTSRRQMAGRSWRRRSQARAAQLARAA